MIGTGLIAVKYKGQLKVAQHVRSNAYPSIQGQIIQKFLKKPDYLNKLKKGLKTVKFISDEELDEIYTSNKEVFEKKYPELWDFTGASVLTLIAFYNKRKIFNCAPMGVDGMSTLVNFTYDIDLDKKTVTVFINKDKKYKKSIYTFDKFIKDDAMQKLEKKLNIQEYALRFPWGITVLKRW